MAPENRLKRALAAGSQQLGLWLTLDSYTATEMASRAGFDWLLIDMEHTAVDLPGVLHHLRACAAGPATPVVRIPWNDPVVIKRVLDLGAQSILVPYVQNEEEARQAVAAVRYPPHGVRGFSGSSRANDYGRMPGYAASAAEEICLLVQVESPAALAAAQGIAAVDGVDGVFIGPNDLAANMGFLAQAAAPEVQAAIGATLASIKAANKAAGLLEFRPDQARERLTQGFDFVATGGDTPLLSAAMAALVQSLR